MQLDALNPKTLIAFCNSQVSLRLILLYITFKITYLTTIHLNFRILLEIFMTV